MTVDDRLRGPLVALLAAGLCFSVGCKDDEGDTDPADDGGESEPSESSNGESDPSTSGEDGSSGGEESSSGGGSSTGEAIDPNIDRTAANILDDPNLCGYPGPGQYGYGGIIDQQRFPNFVLEDCTGTQREFAEFFCERDDEYDDFNHVFIVVFEAVW